MIDDVDALFVSEQVGRIVSVVYGVLQSPNECDRNGEVANVVDGLFAIARAIHHLAGAYEDAHPEPAGGSDDGDRPPRLPIPEEFREPFRRRTGAQSR